ncbi:MAG: nucleotide sugar dehydrogenase [Phycisphaerales bacterium]|jgi:UDP-N-acetyl-D-glucosamine dehydrogenase|nr:nucleotide sugar dehydrogenase [Phycisphaeraceae bacterium]
MSNTPATDQHASAIARFSTGDVVVAVVGLGYVGLPLAHAFHEAGLSVLGVDTDPAKPRALRPAAGERPTPYLRHLGDELYNALASSDRFDATTDHTRLAQADAILVCVPTPLDEQHAPDLSYVVGAALQIARVLRPGMLVVLESTTYPGTTRGEFLAPMRQLRPDLVPGRDYFVAFSPEREDPGNPHFRTRDIPKLVGGIDEPATRAACALYARAFRSVIPVASAEVAESAKLLENTFRGVNIALVNELKMVFDAMGVDIWQVIDAASTKPFGFMRFTPGPGLGGHCIPIDPFYLAHKARELGRPSLFVELAGVINTRMPEYVVSKLDEALRARGSADGLSGARVLVLGLAYKPDIDDVRESPSFEIIDHVRARGGECDYSDPLVPRTHAMRKRDLGMSSVELTPASVTSYDALVLSTAHAAFDYEMIARHARLVVDTRNAFAAHALTLAERLVKA